MTTRTVTRIATGTPAHFLRALRIPTIRFAAQEDITVPTFHTCFSDEPLLITSSDPLWFPEDDTPLAREEDVLALIDALFPSRTPHTPVGRGHDCAELACSANLAISTDFFWQDAHFRTDYFTPAEAGAKALGRAASDLAAAGARPLGFSLGLMLPGTAGRNTLTALLQGMARMADACGMVLTGGDVSRGTSYGFCVTVLGESIGHNFFLRRKQAQEGDAIFLAGNLGMAAAGFQLLESEGRQALRQWPSLCHAHLQAHPLLREGTTLAELALRMPEARIGLMDVSDGPARDLPRLMGGYAADLTFGKETISPDLRRYAESLNLDPELLYLTGGEDYALLGTCAMEAFAAVQDCLPEAKLLGRVRKGQGILRNGKPMQLRGFDHFEAATPSLCVEKRGIPELPPASPVVRGAAARVTDADEKSALAPESLQAASAVIAACAKAWERGLLSGFNGNVSCRTPGAMSDFCVTGTCVAKGAVRLDNIAFMDISGKHLCGAAPSTETELHRAIYACCPRSMAVLHTHPPKLLALSLVLPASERLALPLVEAAVHAKKMGFVENFPPGSLELAEAVKEAAQHYEAVWMEHHGLVVHGPDLDFALALTEELEQIAAVRLDALLSSCLNPLSMA